MNYIVSNNGLGITVGLVGDKEEALCLVNLAHNLYNANSSDEYFSSVIHLSGFKKFKELLIMKEYYDEWDKYWASVDHYKIKEGEEHKTHMTPSFVLKFTKAAIRTVNETIANNVKMENFMQQISSRNNEYQIGGYQDEACEE